MQYGRFDDVNKEYVIERPDTPAPWANYLGSPEYGAIISNNAGGYSFEQSGANGRILKYVFNNFDQPGRYIYIRNNETKDYWSNSWGPVFKDLNTFKSEVRHGTSYSIISSEYDGIKTSTSYYVPLDKKYEVWYVTVTNTTDTVKDLTVSGYCEFTDENNYEQDQVNLQYSLFITKTEFKENRIRNLVKGNFEGVHDDGCDERFFGLAGAKVNSYCGSKEEFLGRYHDYKNPVSIENGDLGNKLNYNMVSCGALATKIVLQPNETIKLAYVLGMRKDKEAEEILNHYSDVTICEKELEELKNYWHAKLSAMQVNTPSKEFNSMLNTWHSYNCFMTFIWSRAASLIYCGLRNGYGYRDTVQDIQGIIHLDPSLAKEKITFMLSAQVDHGAGLPLVKFTHNPGHEDTPEDDSYVRETGHPAYRADDALWLFPTVYKYICETGDLAYLDEVIPFANKDEATAYNHLQRAIDFSSKHLGTHKMPAGLHADWNDCLRLGADGESVFVAMQYYLAMNITKKFAEYKNDKEYISYLDEESSRIKAILDDCWDEDRYIRGYTDQGLTIGGRDSIEANMWLNPQSWSVISDIADKEKAEIAMNSVYERLNTAYGAILMDPPFKYHSFDGALATIFNAGNKENSGIFLQPQGWLILAESLLGHGYRAFEYYKESCPAYQNDKAEIRKLEPYCYGQFTEGKHSMNFGTSHVHWLTGTASTVMVGCVEGILGLRPDPYGLRIEPSIPSDWENLTIDKQFRGSKLYIKIVNPNHKQSGVTRITLFLPIFHHSTVQISFKHFLFVFFSFRAIL